ncbi:hypothetical protein T310_9459, partial [Rasamsonia emersonii CBS 393.64]
NMDQSNESILFALFSIVEPMIMLKIVRGTHPFRSRWLKSVSPTSWVPLSLIRLIMSKENINVPMIFSLENFNPYMAFTMPGSSLSKISSE